MNNLIAGLSTWVQNMVGSGEDDDVHEASCHRQAQNHTSTKTIKCKDCPQTIEWHPPMATEPSDELKTLCQCSWFVLLSFSFFLVGKN